MTQITLRRRGFELGAVQDFRSNGNGDDEVSLEHVKTQWNASRAVLLTGICSSDIVKHRNALSDSAKLYENVLGRQQCDVLLDQAPYHARLRADFESLGSSCNEGDEQEVETLLFDAVKGQSILAEDLWMKVSWLSFYERDESLRFRFSFGVDFVEDVAADKQRQYFSAKLTEAVFPESTIVTNHPHLPSLLANLLNANSVNFVERIIYFNAEQGGAYLHHDRERGHAGVVYAQLTGKTYWLALAKYELVEQINRFIDSCNESNSWPDCISEPSRVNLVSLRKNQTELSNQLESFSNSDLISLINETEPFIHQLIEHDFGYALEPGDVLLLPQETKHNCCWHSVFNVGDQAGQALSFAIRADKQDKSKA